MSPEPHQIVLGILILCGFLVMVGLRLMAQSLDRQRIRYFVNGYGHQLLDIKWAPFGPWAYGERSRVYQIRYLDKEGREHQAYAKTSLTNGVFFSEDRIIKHPSRSEPVDNPQPQAEPTRPNHLDLPKQQETVEEEKARLRKRLAELEQMD